MSVNEDSSTGFIDRLEALRGFAALWVAVGHSMIWLSIGTESALWSKSLFDVHGMQASFVRLVLVFFNGAAAVDVFFVLSGFVLSRSIAGRPLTVQTYSGFCIKRLFRIIPAFWFSLVVVCLYLKTVYPGYGTLPGASNWFNAWYDHPLTSSLAVDNALMLSPSLNPNAWTLSIELAASLCLPALVWILQKGRPAAAFILLAIAGYVAWKYRALPGSLFHYAYMFVAGALIRQYGRHDLARRFAFVLVPAGIFVILLANAAFPSEHPLAADILVAAGATVIIWCIDSGAAHGALLPLDKRPARFLGQISYSFYLLHFVVLYALANLALRHFPQLWIARWPALVMAAVCVISVAIAIPFAALAFRYIEKPSTVAGRQLAQRQRDAGKLGLSLFRRKP